MGGDEPNRPHVQQFLFGYDDGHKLLAGSTELPGRVARRLLVAGDFAVPGEWAGRWPYLTGAPVEEVSAYAISGTWPAPEMRRPGCVWTHTLIIGFTDLARLNNLGLLLSLLRRPSKGGLSLQGYATPLAIAPSERLCAPPPVDVLSPMLEALYAEPRTRCVVFSADDGTVDAVMALWSQQWPRLRRTFRFASRAWEEGQGVLDRADDLLLLTKGPSRRHAQVETLGQGIDFIGGTWSHGRKRDQSPWLEDACEDALGRSNGSLRAFLRRYGADVTGGRTAFAGLVEAYRLSHEAETSAATFGRLFRTHFANPAEARKLKSDLLAGRFDDRASDPTRRLRWIEAMETGFPGALDAIGHSLVLGCLNDVTANNGLEPLWMSLERTAHLDAKEWRSLLLEVVSRRASPTLALSRLGPTEAYAFLAERSPAFVELADAWRHPELARRLLDLAARHDIPLDRIVALAMESDDESIAVKVLEDFGGRAVAGIIGAIERGRKPDGAWLSALGSSDEALAGAMETFGGVRARTVGILLKLLDHSPAARRVPPSAWAVFTRSVSVEVQIPRRERIPLAARLFVIAVRQPGPGSEELLARTFEPLHDAAADGEIDSTTWNRLEDHVPGRWTYWHWDRCERLRSATCQAFVQVDLEPWRFLELAGKRKTFEALVRTLRYMSDGIAFVRKLRRMDRENLSPIACRNLTILEKW